MKSTPADKKPFSYQQSGKVSLVNGGLTVKPEWNTTTPSKLPSGSQGDLFFHNGTKWVSFPKAGTGTYVLASVNGNIQWFATEGCS